MLTDGTTAKREIVNHNGGVAVVPLTENDEILMVRQFRAPYRETIYEIPAILICRNGSEEFQYTAEALKKQLPF